MEIQLFIYEDVAIQFYYDKESTVNDKIKVKNIFIYFAGLPQFLDRKFFESRVNKDTAFLSVHYLGSWLSGNKFSCENCHKTIDLAVKFVKQQRGKNVYDGEEFYWQYEAVSLVGYSFAGNFIMTAKLNPTDIKEIILFAPLLIVAKEDFAMMNFDEKLVESFYDYNIRFLEFLRRGYKFVYRGIEDRCWDNYFLGLDKNSFLMNKENSIPLAIYVGDEDDEIILKSAKYFSQITKNVKIKVVNFIGHNLEKLWDSFSNN